MPIGLADACYRDWERISKLPSCDMYRALAILRWTVFAARSLTVLDMTEALAVSENDCDNTQTEEIPDIVDDEYTNDEILDLCGSLVEIRDAGPEKHPKDKTVGLGAKRVDGRRAMRLSPGRFMAYGQFPASNGRKKHSWLARLASCSFLLAVVAAAAPLRINVFSWMIHYETMKTVESACLFSFCLMS